MDFLASRPHPVVGCRQKSRRPSLHPLPTDFISAPKLLRAAISNPAKVDVQCHNGIFTSSFSDFLLVRLYMLVELLPTDSPLFLLLCSIMSLLFFLFTWVYCKLRALLVSSMCTLLFHSSRWLWQVVLFFFKNIFNLSREREYVVQMYQVCLPKAKYHWRVTTLFFFSLLHKAIVIRQPPFLIRNLFRRFIERLAVYRCS